MDRYRIPLFRLEPHRVPWSSKTSSPFLPVYCHWRRVFRFLAAMENLRGQKESFATQGLGFHEYEFGLYFCLLPGVEFIYVSLCESSFLGPWNMSSRLSTKVLTYFPIESCTFRINMVRIKCLFSTNVTCIRRKNWLLTFDCGPLKSLELGTFQCTF